MGDYLGRLFQSVEIVSTYSAENRIRSHHSECFLGRKPFNKLYLLFYSFDDKKKENEGLSENYTSSLTAKVFKLTP